MTASAPDVYRKTVKVTFHCERDVSDEAILSLNWAPANLSLPPMGIQHETKRTPRLIHLKFEACDDESRILENDVIEALGELGSQLYELGLKPFEFRIEAVKSIPMFSSWLTPNSLQLLSGMGFRLTSSVQVVNTYLPVSIIRMLEAPEEPRPRGRNEKWRRRRRYYSNVAFVVKCKEQTPAYVAETMRRKPTQVIERKKDNSQICFYGFISSRQTANDAFAELLAALQPSIPAISLLKEHCDVHFSIGLFSSGAKDHNLIRLEPTTVELVSRFECGLDLSIYL